MLGEIAGASNDCGRNTHTDSRAQREGMINIIRGATERFAGMQSLKRARCVNNNSKDSVPRDEEGRGHARLKVYDYAAMHARKRELSTHFLHSVRFFHIFCC